MSKLVRKALDEAVGKWDEKTGFSHGVRSADLEEMITTYLGLTGQTLSKPRRAVRTERASSTDRVFIRRHDVERMTGLARSTIYDFMSKGKFPKPIKLSERNVGWLEADVNDWIDSRIATKA